jgi:hypothetical protein
MHVTFLEQRKAEPITCMASQGHVMTGKNNPKDNKNFGRLFDFSSLR